MAEAALGLDVGDARIGVARGEIGFSFVFGRGYIKRSQLAADLDAVMHAIREERATLVVVGLPRRTDGSDSEQTKKARRFALELERRIAASNDVRARVALEDERFTTKLATQGLAQGGASRRKRHEKGSVDEASAVLILQGYLERLRRTEGSSGGRDDGADDGADDDG